MRASIRRQLRSSFAQDDTPRSKPSLIPPPTPPFPGQKGQQTGPSKLDILFKQYASIIGVPADQHASSAVPSQPQMPPTDPAIVNNIYKLGVTDLSGVLTVLRTEFDKLNPTDDRSMKFERIAQVKNVSP